MDRDLRNSKYPSKMQKLFYLLFKRFYLFIFRERKGGRKREEPLTCERNINRFPLVGALTWDNPLICGTMSKQLSHIGQGQKLFKKTVRQN